MGKKEESFDHDTKTHHDLLETIIHEKPHSLRSDTDFNSVEACDFKDKNILILDNTPETINKKGNEKEKQKKMPKRHTCDHCKSTFCTNRVLKDHVNSVHLKIKPYKCKNC